VGISFLQASEDVQKLKTEKATFAGGCFWCMQPPFDKLKGVIRTTVGYTGGVRKHPSYSEVSAGITGHTESIEIVYYPSQVSYQELLKVFWRTIDPTAKDRQFTDVGNQYRTAIFYHDPEQMRLAKASKAQLEQSGRYEGSIVTEVQPVSRFYPAEEAHQKYYKKHPIRYRYYRVGSGRDAYLRKIWGTPSK